MALTTFGISAATAGTAARPAKLLRDNGQTVTIADSAAADDAPYVQRLSLNGAAYASAWIPIATLADGGILSFVLGRSPSTTWGTGTSVAPPSFNVR